MKVTDHTGKEYKSFTEMCEAYGKSRGCVQGRISNGMSLKEALTEPKTTRGKECVDHLGNTYKSLEEMCRAYEIQRKTFLKRLERGYNLKDALTLKNNTINKNKSEEATKKPYIK